MTFPSITPPLHHIAAISRNVVTGPAPSGLPLPPRYEPYSELPCQYWHAAGMPQSEGPSGLRLGPAVDLVGAGPRMLVSRAADVRVDDRVTEVRAGETVITSSVMRVVDDLWRQTHRELYLEQAAGINRAGQESGS